MEDETIVTSPGPLEPYTFIQLDDTDFRITCTCVMVLAMLRELPD